MRASTNQLQFACHRFDRGTKFGVALRQYWPQRHGDDDAFQKLTVVFQREPQPGQRLTLPSDQVFIFFSSGPSSFPGRHGCYGVARSGEIDVQSSDKHSIKLEINVDLDLKSPLGWTNECKKSNVRMALDAKFISFDELTPWYGRQSQSVSIWDEAHPAN